VSVGRQGMTSAERRSWTRWVFTYIDSASLRPHTATCLPKCEKRCGAPHDGLTAAHGVTAHSSTLVVWAVVSGVEVERRKWDSHYPAAASFGSQCGLGARGKGTHKEREHTRHISIHFTHTNDTQTQRGTHNGPLTVCAVCCRCSQWTRLVEWRLRRHS
jgi:hypothetical protein